MIFSVNEPKPTRVPHAGISEGPVSGIGREAKWPISDGGPLLGTRKILKNVRNSAKQDVNSFLLPDKAPDFTKLRRRSKCAQLGAIGWTID